MKKLNKKAFTLIELLVVIAVVGILVLLGAPKFMGHTQKAELIRIQHDTRVMEEEVRTVLINEDDDFNKWKNNMKDLNQLAQEDKLFEKEGFAEEVDASHLAANKTVDLTKLNVGGDLHELTEDLSISETYKVIPERYKDEINSKLKGTFYANSDGKVYYEHVKPLSRTLTGFEEEPGYSEEEQEIQDLINDGFIPVATADELNNVRSATLETYGEGTKWKGKYTGGLDKKYVQVANIDLSGYSEGAGWKPVGTSSASFIGTYDGNGHKITRLTINRSETDYVGLFGYTEGATISNVALEDINVTGEDYVGGLVGSALGGTTISNSYATGSVTGEGKNPGFSNVAGGWVGGLVGEASNITIENSYATDSVTGTRNNIGGLVGGARESTKISNSYAKGKVTGTAVSPTKVSSAVGGLVGGASKSTEISNSYATGTVEGRNNVGGLVGAASTEITIENSYAKGNVTGTFSIGGLVGQASKSTEISNSYATGTVENTKTSYAGGLVGYAWGDTKISTSYATGSVKGTYVESTYDVGGLVGLVENSTISNSYATGSVESTGLRVGGLVGQASGSNGSNISNSYAKGSVTGRGSVGGLVGKAWENNNIENSYWDTVTTGRSWSSGGGIGKTSVEMKLKETYKDGDSGWNFDAVWEITPGNYPTLR